MPLLDHFHPPLHGPRRWEGFHHSWATFIAQQLNQEVLPSGYFAESEISLGPELEIDVATMELSRPDGESKEIATAVWAPPRPKIAVKVDFAHLDSYEIRVYQDLGGAEFAPPSNWSARGTRIGPAAVRTFAAKCAGYLQHGIGVVIVDVVTSRTANLHAELLDTLEVKSRRAVWQAPTYLYAVAYRPVTLRKSPRVEAWPETLTLGQTLPTLPLWLVLDLCVPVRLEASYIETCRSLRIPA